jgi:circadian clock protein KaiC
MSATTNNLPKVPTGIEGLDDITGGGLPRGRSTLLCGGAGTGKTLLAFEFLVRGASLFNEPGVFVAFEESAAELGANVASFGFDVAGLMAKNQLEIDHIYFEHSHVSGVFDLDGLFIRLDMALKKVNAKRVVLDSIDVLFLALANPVLVREEMRRLVHWLKARGLTSVITAESGEKYLTRDGMEEYVSDCVILLENRITYHAATRLLRVVKYRGSAHGTNEYPFLIGEKGISVLPITALMVDLPSSCERVSSGIVRLDTMLGGSGYYRDSMVLVSGPPGSGKSSLAAEFARAACARGERCLYFLMEESSQQVVRNMQSIGINLQPGIDQGLLHFVMTRPTLYGLEIHLAKIEQAINNYKPSAVVFDPITSLHIIAEPVEVEMMLVRLVNFLKAGQITGYFVSISDDIQHSASTEIGISTLIDSWVQLRDVESDGERNRLIVVLKSRGMAHSNQMREFILSERGIELLDVYTGPNGVLTGSARIAQQAREEDAVREQQAEIERRSLLLNRKRLLKDAHVAVLEEELVENEVELKRSIARTAQQKEREWKTRHAIAQSRKADEPVAQPGPASGTQADASGGTS